MNANSVLKLLKAIQLENVFNPYTDTCPDHDVVGAPKIRQKNLMAYMEAMQGQVESMWFGRDLGYLGGRRTGLALTDEGHLDKLASKYSAEGIKKATRGPAVRERTATTTWSLIDLIESPPFLWNIFPFHPHAQGDAASNRCHTKNEYLVSIRITDALLSWGCPSRLIAIGNDAKNGLTRLKLECYQVRHPSYGGTSEFISKMSDLYSLPRPVANRQAALF
jgi:hypothetical protein